MHDVVDIEAKLRAVGIVEIIKKSPGGVRSGYGN